MRSVWFVAGVLAGVLAHRYRDEIVTALVYLQVLPAPREV